MDVEEQYRFKTYNLSATALCGFVRLATR